MSGKYDNVEQAVLDLDAFLQTTEAEVGPRSGMSKGTYDRCRAAKAAAKLRAGWLPSEAL